MIIADWVAIGVIVLFCIIGFVVGFGRGLAFFTSGFFGFLISVMVCYFIGGLIIKLSIVQELLSKLTDLLVAKDTGFCNFLIKIHIEIIAYYVALFIIVQILRVIIVSIIKSVSEIENGFVKFINRTLGIILMAAVLFMITLIVFQIIHLIGGSLGETFSAKLSGSKLGLTNLYENNPLMNIMNFLKLKIEVPA